MLEAAKVVVSWRDNDHLELGHYNDAKVFFQVVKYGGAEISVKNLGERPQ